jgi:hypothetical protein
MVPSRAGLLNTWRLSQMVTPQHGPLRDGRSARRITTNTLAAFTSWINVWIAATPLWVKRRGTSQVRRRSLSAVDPIATTLLQRRE